MSAPSSLDRARRVAALGLTLRHVGDAWIAVAALGVVYALTLATGMTFFDSPELALVAADLGVGHPIGQPLHTLLGHLFVLAFGDANLGLSVMSALFGALAALPMFAIAQSLSGPVVSPLERALRGVAIVSIGVSVIAWEPATRVEVYTLAAFCSLHALAIVAARFDVRRALAAGILLGLAACANAVIAASTAVAVGLVAFAALRALPRPAAARTSGAIVLGGLCGLSPYVHVPLAASDPDRFAWGAPRDLASFWRYIRGVDFTHNQGIDLESWLAHWGSLLGWGLLNATLIVFAVGAVGFALHERPGLRWAPLITFALLGSFVAANVVFHVDIPDYRGYALVPQWLAAAGLASLVGYRPKRSVEKSAKNERATGFVALLGVLALVASPAHLRARRDHPSLADAMSDGALEEIPRDAIVLVEADHWAATLMFRQHVDGERGDVVVIALGLASSRWTWDMVFRRHPTLAPMELVGPGHSIGRMRRLIAANPERPVLVESSELAVALGRRICGAGWLVWTEDACLSEPPDPERATATIARIAPRSQEAREVAGRVGEARAEVLWRMGRARAAARAMLAGIELEALPDAIAAEGPALTGPLPAWSREHMVHDLARNYVFAALILHSVGRADEALALVAIAESLGLDEAQIARAQIAP